RERSIVAGRRSSRAHVPLGVFVTTHYPQMPFAVVAAMGSGDAAASIEPAASDTVRGARFESVAARLRWVRARRVGLPDRRRGAIVCEPGSAHETRTEQ